MKYAEHKIKLLRKARGYIENYDTYYICFALRDAYATLDYSDQLMTDYIGLKRWVRRLLGNCNCLEDWYRQHHHKLYSRPDYDPTAIRLAWIDWMIKEIGNGKRH